MIIANTEHGIALRWRDEQGKREEKLVGFSDFSPYFFVKEDCPVVVDGVSSIQLYESWGDRGSTFPLELRYEFGDWVNLDGDKLAKVTWYPSLPKYTKKVKSYFHNRAYPTYEADVRHHYRYSVDMIKNMPEYKLRKWYWDMEWMQGGEHDGAITCIVIYDNYDDEYYTLSWKPDSNETEKTVLERFILMINEKDPDMLISWFGWKFDLPKLLERMDILDVPARELSPIKEVDGIRWSTKQRCNILNPKIVNNYSPIAQPIKGRICVPLDLAFERQWNDAQRGTLPSLSLDYVSENV